MNEIEKKNPGTFTKGLRDKTSDVKGFDTDRMALKEEELSYAIGKEASTQKKIAKAAGAILQFVGRYAFIAGSKAERTRCKEYINWLLQQMRSSVTIPDVARREDATEIHVPMNCKGWVTGNRGSELRRMEQETGVYMCMALDSRGDERLIIFGSDPGSKSSPNGRMAAERLVTELIQEKLRDDGGRGGGGGGRGRSRGRSNSRQRERSPPRGRSDSRRRERSPPRRSPSYRGGRGGGGRSRSPPRRNDRSPPRR